MISTHARKYSLKPSEAIVGDEVKEGQDDEDDGLYFEP